MNYKIDYTTFKEKKTSEEDDKILNQFIENVPSKHASGIRRYIEERASEEFPNYTFKWKGDAYLSKPEGGKEIYIRFVNIGRLNFDAFIFNKTPK